MTDIPKIKLNDGNKIPQLGFGVFQIPNHDDAVKAVESAIRNGYRLIDTAEAYNNQTAVGEAIKNSDVNRDDIFLTTKLWVSNFTYEKATKAIDHDLQELGTDYIDMMLLHQAYDDVAVEAWAPFVEGKDCIFTNPVLAESGKKYGKSNSQVILRWLIQRGIIVILKSVHDARQKENIDAFDFELSDDDMQKIAELDKNVSQFFDDHHDPATIEQIFGSSLSRLRR